MTALKNLGLFSSGVILASMKLKPNFIKRFSQKVYKKAISMQYTETNSIGVDWSTVTMLPNEWLVGMSDSVVVFSFKIPPKIYWFDNIQNPVTI